MKQLTKGGVQKQIEQIEQARRQMQFLGIVLECEQEKCLKDKIINSKNCIKDNI